MELKIYAEGEVLRNEDAIAEAEITASFLEATRAYGIYSSRANIYAEAEESKSSGGGFFKKIINFFSNLINKIIDFIKRFINKVIEIISKPFGSKMAKASTGGSSGSTTERASSPTNIINGSSSNVEEISSVIKDVVKYATASQPKEFDRDHFKGVDITGIDKLNDITDTVLPDRIYNKATVNEIIKKATSAMLLLKVANRGIGDTVKSTSVEDIYKLMDDSYNPLKRLKQHKSFSMRVKLMKNLKSSEYDINELASALSCGQVIINGVIRESKKFINSANKIMASNKSDINKEMAYTKQIAAVIDPLNDTNVDNEVRKKVMIENPYNVFGLPAKEAVSVYKYGMIASGGSDVIKLVSSELIQNTIVKRAYLRPFNIKSITKYGDMFNKPIFDASQVDKLFKEITVDGSKTISENLKTIDKPVKDKSVDSLKDLLESVKTVNANLNNKSEDTDTSMTDDMIEKLNIVKDNINSGKGSTAIKSFINASATNVRAMSTAVVKFADDLKNLYDTVESIQYIPIVYVSANAIYWLVDILMAHLNSLIEFKKTEKFKELYKTENDVKAYDAAIKNIKDNYIENLKTSLKINK